MKKMIILITALFMAMPMVAGAQGLLGDCYDCHTMHNSEQGLAVLELGDGTTTGTPIANLLRMDCIACHAAEPASGNATVTMTGGSVIPQVAHGQGMNGLAGGNFSYVDDTIGLGSRYGHNVNDLFGENGAISTQYDTNVGARNEPPGLVHTSDRGAFTVSNAFDAFTCAGARGCHGTRNQLLTADISTNADGNFAENAVMRTGLAAVSGAHHDNWDGFKNAVNPADNAEAVHVGSSTNTGAWAEDFAGYGVADGYRFIRGLKGYGNNASLANRWKNVSAAEHNEYFGVAGGMGSGCGACHIQSTGDAPSGETDVDGIGSRLGFDSTIVTPNNSMSGFCSSCHGVFHSGGAGNDYVDNGVSGAFLRHPSDYIIPETGEYAAYDVYDLSAPVARPAAAFSAGMGSSDVVAGGTDMVMCLSCHVAHGADQEYMLRFDYTTMTAGFYGDITAATAVGGCLACHTEKGVLPENR